MVLNFLLHSTALRCCSIREKNPKMWILAFEANICTFFLLILAHYGAKYTYNFANVIQSFIVFPAFYRFWSIRRFNCNSHYYNFVSIPHHIIKTEKKIIKFLLRFKIFSMRKINLWSFFTRVYFSNQNVTSRNSEVSGSQK